MQVFGIQTSLAAPARVLAATYAHNQLYYDHSDLQASHRKRWAYAHAAQSHMRKAAAGIVSVLHAAGNLKEAAAAVRESMTAAANRKSNDAITARDQADSAEQLKRLLSAYNSALQSLDEATPYLKRSVRSRLTDAAAGYETYGILQNSDGTLELDEEKLKGRMSEQFEHVMAALAGKGGLADKLIHQSEQLGQEPASAMLSPRFNLQPPLTSYQYQLMRGGTFQSGLLLDAVI